METFYLSMPWGKMAYYSSESSGAAHAMIFLHGTGCDSSEWEKVIARLPPDARLIRMDFRGHGNSSVPSEPFTLTDLATDVIKLAEYLNLQQPILAGHSLGGMAAMAAAQKAFQPGALILAEGWTNLKNAAKAFREPRFFGRLDPMNIKEIQKKNEKTIARFQPEVWDYFWQSVQVFDAGDFLESTSLPIREIYGNLGRIETTRRNLLIPSKPNIELIWLNDAGHYLPVEKSLELADICRRVLETC